MIGFARRGHETVKNPRAVGCGDFAQLLVKGRRVFVQELFGFL